MVKAAHSVGILTGVFVSLVFLGFALFLFYLHYRNRNPKPAPMQEVSRSKIVKILSFFIVDVALEIIGLIFTIFAIIGLETRDWSPLDMSKIRIAFYVLQSLKYALLIFSVYTEHVSEEIDDKITYRLSRFGIRSDWKELLEGLIFIPSVIVDGMCANAEYQVQDFGLVFNGDGIVLCAIDVLLWIKLCMKLLLHQYSAKGNPPYQVKQFAYALIIFFYSVFLVFLFIIVHHVTIKTTGMKVTGKMVIILVNALTHSYVCSYSSMMSPGIIMLDKALRGSDARVQQLRIFIMFLQINVISVILTLGVLAYTAYVYFSILTISLATAANYNNDEAAQGAMVAVTIFIDIWTVFLMANLAYAFLKRVGGYLNIRRILCIPFPDCTTYSEQINGILGQCSANFRLDTRGQVSGGGRR